MKNDLAQSAFVDQGRERTGRLTQHELAIAKKRFSTLSSLPVEHSQGENDRKTIKVKAREREKLEKRNKKEKQWS